jgi:TetR/AcrR family mexXY operon transcriptional repressor
MARKTKSETQKTIENILDAAQRVFVLKGVAHATMADIAHEAGISRGAIYGHYPDKIEVCLASCTRAMASSAAILRACPTELPLQTLHRWGMDYLKLIHSPTSLRSALEILYLKCELSPEYEPLLKMRQAWEKKSWRATNGLIRRAVTEGQLKADLDLDLSNTYLQSLLAGVSALLWYGGSSSAECWAKVEKLLSAGIDTLQSSPQFSGAKSA